MHIDPSSQSDHSQPEHKRNRRTFLKTSAITIAAAAATATQPQASARGLHGNLFEPAMPQPNPQPLPFCHGVASGDPLPDAVVIWTRVTPDENAVPGSMQGTPTAVHWEVSQSEDFTSVVASGDTVSSRSSDHTIHVDVQDLKPATVYFYRFTVTDGPLEGAVSPVGRTLTAPANDAAIRSMTLATFSCAYWENGYYAPYRDLAERAWRGEVHLAVFLGDYIYEYAPKSDKAIKPVRLFEPNHETISLQDYRIRYGQTRTDPDVQAAHGALPWIMTWDDHEVANNNYKNGAENHTPMLEGDYEARRAAASKAYTEWMPVRAKALGDGGFLYRSFTFGDLFELSMMDLRTYRDKAGVLDGVISPTAPRRMLGDEQYAWLIDTIRKSNASWNLLGNSVMFSPLALGVLRTNPTLRPVLDAMTETMADSAQLFTNVRDYGVLINSDQWDGYLMERKRLITDLAEAGATPFFLTGDIHSEWAHTIYDDETPLGCEMVCTSITSSGAGDYLKRAVGKHDGINSIAYAYLGYSNPQMRHVNLDAHGYCLTNIRPDDVDMIWMRTANIADPNSAVRPAAQLTWKKGVGFTA